LLRGVIATQARLNGNFYEGNLTEFAIAESPLRAALGEVEYERKHRLGETLSLQAVVDLLLRSQPDASGKMVPRGG
jgi:hypothetical protein